MEGIWVALVLIRCTSGLLLCDTIPTDNFIFTDPDTCRSEASKLVRVRSLKSSSEVWMAKCRYRLISSDNRESRQAQELLY
jgi:hypothetical protein